MPSPMHYLLQQTAGSGGMGGLMNSAEFILPLQDLGNGAVDTSLGRGVGPATFTRATAAATKLSTGLWKLDVASGTARSSYIGLTTAVGSYGGYLAEGAATQLLAAGSIRDMTNVAWVSTTMTAAKTSTGIDGVTNSCTRLTAAGANSTLLQTVTAAASSRTYSCWIKRITGTGAIGICQDGTTFTDITSLINSATFTLVQLNASQLNAVVGIRLVTSTDAIDVDCNQFEAGAFATTPIPAAGTRNQDVLTYPLAGNLDNTVGASYAEFTPTALPALDARIVADNGGASTGVLLHSATGRVEIYDGATVQLGPVGVLVVGTTSKIASSWGANIKAFLSGSVGSSGAFDGNMSMTIIAISNSSGNPDYGTVKNIRIWQRQIADAALQALTT